MLRKTKFPLTQAKVIYAVWWIFFSSRFPQLSYKVAQSHAQLLGSTLQYFTLEKLHGWRSATWARHAASRRSSSSFNFGILRCHPLLPCINAIWVFQTHVSIIDRCVQDWSRSRPSERLRNNDWRRQRLLQFIVGVVVIWQAVVSQTRSFRCRARTAACISIWFLASRTLGICYGKKKKKQLRLNETKTAAGICSRGWIRATYSTQLLAQTTYWELREIKKVRINDRLANPRQVDQLCRQKIYKIEFC